MPQFPITDPSQPPTPPTRINTIIRPLYCLFFLLITSSWGPPSTSPTWNPAKPCDQCTLTDPFHFILNQKLPSVISQSKSFTFYSWWIKILTSFGICLTSLCCIFQICDVGLFCYFQADEGCGTEMDELILFWWVNDMVDQLLLNKIEVFR